MAPPWSHFEKRLHFLKVEPFFSLIIMFEKKTIPLCKVVLKRYRNGGSTFFFQCRSELRVLLDKIGACGTATGAKQLITSIEKKLLAHFGVSTFLPIGSYLPTTV